MNAALTWLHDVAMVAWYFSAFVAGVLAVYVGFLAFFGGAVCAGLAGLWCMEKATWWWRYGRGRR